MHDILILFKIKINFLVEFLLWVDWKRDASDQSIHKSRLRWRTKISLLKYEGNMKLKKYNLKSFLVTYVLLKILKNDIV